MGREQWFAGSGEMLLASVQQAVQPWQQFLRAVVGVQNNRHAVMLSHLVNMMCTRDSAQNCCTLRNVSLHAFTGDKRGTAVRELYDNRSTHLRCCFQHGVDGVGTYAVHCWQSKVVLFSYCEYFLNVITSDDTRFYEIKNFRHVTLSCFVGRRWM
ncbi:hypothetical protein D3C80_381700 [compost metagenome]